MNRALVIFLGSLLAASGAQATTYVRVEKDGTKTYSDRPIPGGQPIDLQPAQTYSAPPVTDSNSNVPREQQALMQAANFQYQSCALTPKNDESFSNPESVTVSLSLSPGLRYGDQVIFNVDGAAIPGTSPTFSMPQPARGSHSVSAQVTDRSGKSLCSANTTFHVMRPSLNAPARRPRPTPH